MRRTSSLAALVLALAAVGLGGSCATLGDYPVGVCGNSVLDVEAGEQCDSHVEPGQVCGAPDGANACRYVCPVTEEAEQERAACPPGFACGLDEVCHRASGRFDLASIQDGFALGSRVADFDGSGAAEVLTAGFSRFDIASYDDAGNVSTTQSLGGGLFNLPSVGHLDGASADGGTYADAVFTKAGDVVVALGTSSGLTPKSYAGVRLGFPPPAFFFGVPGGLSAEVDLDAALALGTLNGNLDRIALILLTGDDVLTVDTTWPIQGVLPVYTTTGPLDETSPNCNEVVFQYPSFLATWRPCPNGARVAFEGESVPPEPPTKLELAPSPSGASQTIAGRPSLADLDGDGHLELVVTVNECPDLPGACDPLELRAPEHEVGGGSVEYCCHPYVGWPDIETVVTPGGPTAINRGRFQSRQGGGGDLDVLERRPALVLLAEDGDDPDDQPDPVAINPIAWGDFNGDGLADFVTSFFVLIGFDGELQPGEPPFLPVASNGGLPWVDAQVGDVDGDGLDDVVAVPFATSALNYLRGTAGSTLGYATVQTERPYEQVLMGDMDGDGRRDIIGKARNAAGSAEELDVLYFEDGSFGTPRAVGSFATTPGPDPNNPYDDESNILQMAVARLVTTFDALDDLVVATRYLDAGEEAVGLALFEGRSDRQLVAPIVITEGGGTVDVELTTFGHFTAGVTTIVADRFAIDLDANLELSGQAKPIVALEEDALETLFPAGVEGGVDTLLGAGNFDDDPEDELLVAVPGCQPLACPGEGRQCCVAGTEESRILLLDRPTDAGGAPADFVPAQVAPSPLSVPGLTARTYADENDVRLGRMAVVDLDGDGRSEALVLAGRRADRVFEGTVLLVEQSGGSLIAQPLPLDLPEGRANAFGFAAATDADGASTLLVASNLGLFAVPVKRVADPAPGASSFEFGKPYRVLDSLGEPVARHDISAVATGDVNGDGILDIVLTGRFSTEVHLGAESLAPPGVTP